MRRRERDLNHIDTEERRIGIILGIGAAANPFSGAHPAGALRIDVQIRFILRIGDQCVGVRAAAGLNRRNLLWVADITDVEDTDTAEALRADGRVNACVPQSMRPRVCSTDMKSRFP